MKKGILSLLDRLRGKGAVEKPADLKVGEIITFGHYEQDNDLTNGPEPIEWQVLAVESSRALVISKYALDAKPYVTTKTGIPWKENSLRIWLNGEFFSKAFSTEEQERILQVTLKDEKNPEYNSKDRIFLLYVFDVQKYLKTNRDRQCRATAYAQANGGDTQDNDYIWWWLRMPYIFSRNLATGFVKSDGETTITDAVPYMINLGVRPVFWLKR